MDTIALQVKMRRLALSAGLAALAAACSKAPEAATSTAAPSPPSSPSLSSSPDRTASFTASAVPEPNPAVPADAHLHVLPPAEGSDEALPPFPLALEALYFTDTTPLARRLEIVHALGRIDTAESVAILGRIFDRDKRLDARMAVIEVTADFRSPTTHAGKLAIFTHAVAPTQAQALRLVALQTLSEIDDPSVPPLLQTLAADPSPTIREAMTAILLVHKQ